MPSYSLTLRKASRPASGSASSANQPSITGSSVRWIAARRLTPVVSASRCRSAPAGSRKPRAASRSRAASGRQPHLVRAQPGGGGQQRAVEEPLVQPAHLAGLGLPLGDHLAGRVAPVPDRAPEPAQVGLVGGHEVGAPQPEQLDAVLQRPQQPVGRVQHRGVVAADVAAAAQRRERVERRARAQRLVDPPVHELQQLHAELDVAQAARPELELAVGLAGGHVLLDPAPHRLHVLDEVRPVGRRPDHRPDRVDVAPGRARGRRPPAAP